MARYLLCPQCGSHRFFLRDEARGTLYFYVDGNGRPVPTESSPGTDLAGLDFSRVGCCGCSWQGSLRKLVAIFTG